jgi:competence protein ComEA
MRRLILIGLSALVVTGCAWFRDPPEQGVTTGATVVYTGSKGGEVFSICDKGNLIYLTKSNPQVAVVHGGCNPDLGHPGAPPPVAVAAASERTPPVPQPLMVHLPQPFLVQVVPPNPPSVVAPLSAEREPVIVQIQPQTLGPTYPQPCPACPTPPLFTPQAAPVPAPAPPRPAVRTTPSAKTMVVAQVDPNTASTEDMERLPGVTAKMAAAIVRGRPYRSLQELASKKALTEADLQSLAPYFVIR